MTDDLWVARRDAYLVDVMRIIDERGCAVQCVFATEASQGADFAYTVGLTARNWPELMVTGMPLEMAHDLLNILADREAIARKGGWVPGSAALHGYIEPVTAEKEDPMRGVR